MLAHLETSERSFFFSPKQPQKGSDFRLCCVVMTFMNEKQKKVTEL